MNLALLADREARQFCPLIEKQLHGIWGRSFIIKGHEIRAISSGMKLEIYKDGKIEGIAKFDSMDAYLLIAEILTGVEK